MPVPATFQYNRPGIGRSHHALDHRNAQKVVGSLTVFNFLSFGHPLRRGAVHPFLIAHPHKR
jgi:hypothetical protein